MRYYALACDYDGTIALHGKVDEQTIAALEHTRNSGRSLILVTGRELDDLMRVFPRIDLFTRVVAENGALLYRPESREAIALAPSPPSEFIAELQARKVTPLSVGQVIVATWEPHETTVLETIRDLGLELEVIFNKGAVMVLPTGVNKASGLLAALDELGLSPHNVVSVGDAENDHAFLRVSECAVAVDNALLSLKARVDWVTTRDHGAGVVELIKQLLADDLRSLTPSQVRHQIALGKRDDEVVSIDSYATTILLAGPSGSGKSTFATSFMERLREQAYQFCIVDPEGDYQQLQGTVSLGDSRQPPVLDEVLKLLEQPSQNVVVNLLGIALEDRPAYFEKLLSALVSLRARTGRPHWLVIDETHHLLPTSWSPVSVTLPQALTGLMMITVHPDHVAGAALSFVQLLIAIGQTPEETLRSLAQALDRPIPADPPRHPEAGEAVAWWLNSDAPPFVFESIPPQGERKRHVRKYLAGELPPERSFYFRGPNGKLNLRAQNLSLFLQSAEGVDDETWMYHLHQGDYSRWIRDAIKDDELSQEISQIERLNIPPHESRARIRERIELRYTDSA